MSKYAPVTPETRSPYPRGARRTLIGGLRHRGAHAEVERILSTAAVRAEGVLVRMADSVDLGERRLRRILPDYPRVRRVIEAERARRRGAPGWLVKSLRVLEGGLMEITAQILEAAAGMTVEQLVTEIQASQHAGECDPQALAEAIAASATPG